MRNLKQVEPTGIEVAGTYTVNNGVRAATIKLVDHYKYHEIQGYGWDVKISEGETERWSGHGFNPWRWGYSCRVDLPDERLSAITRLKAFLEKEHDIPFPDSLADRMFKQLVLHEQALYLTDKDPLVMEMSSIALDMLVKEADVASEFGIDGLNWANPVLELTGLTHQALDSYIEKELARLDEEKELIEAEDEFYKEYIQSIRSPEIRDNLDTLVNRNSVERENQISDINKQTPIYYFKGKDGYFLTPVVGVKWSEEENSYVARVINNDRDYGKDEFSLGWRRKPIHSVEGLRQALEGYADLPPTIAESLELDRFDTKSGQRLPQNVKKELEDGMQLERWSIVQSDNDVTQVFIFKDLPGAYISKWGGLFHTTTRDDVERILVSGHEFNVIPTTDIRIVNHEQWHKQWRWGFDFPKNSSHYRFRAEDRAYVQFIQDMKTLDAAARLDALYIEPFGSGLVVVKFDHRDTTFLLQRGNLYKTSAYPQGVLASIRTSVVDMDSRQIVPAGTVPIALPKITLELAGGYRYQARFDTHNAQIAEKIIQTPTTEGIIWNNLAAGGSKMERTNLEYMSDKGGGKHISQTQKPNAGPWWSL